MDLIERQAAIDALESIGSLDTEADKKYARSVFEALPSVQPETHDKRTETHACDLISRQAAIDVMCELMHHWFGGDTKDEVREIKRELEKLPAVQPEPLSDAYTKAVWTWLLDYQIKAAKLKGRYTPYEVLSWVANDWRKEHEGSD